MGKRAFTPVAFMVAACIFLMGFAAVVPQAISAQGTVATPAEQGEPAETAAFPAHIHSGTCAELGEVVFPLSDVTAFEPQATPDASGSLALASTPVTSPVAASPVASPEAVQAEVVAESSTEVAASLDDILAEEHAINVHESEQNIQNYIACGDLTGSPTNGELTIELQQLNSSGYVGEAHLRDNGDGTTTVTVYLMLSGLGMNGTPQATPSS